MRRRQLFALTLAGALALAAGAGRAADDEPAPAAPAATPQEQAQEALYLEAMRSLAEGRANEASVLLTRFLEREPQHAGAWLDLAISQCALGHAAEAERLFGQIEQRFAPPPGIRDVIEQHRARGCAAPARSQLALAVARGHDSNVNQGASNRFFSTGSGASATEWELAPGFLPRADDYSVFNGDYSYQFGPLGTLAVFQLHSRWNDQLHLLDSHAALLGADQPWQAGNWRGRTTATFGVVRLGGELYQRQSQLQLRLTPPLALPAGLNGWLSGAVSHVAYPTRSKYNANTLELGATLAWRGPRAELRTSLAAQSDRGEIGRPGGDRAGWFGGLQLFSRLSDKTQLELGWTRQDWRSASVYSPGLIEAVRRQSTRQASAQLSYALRAHQTLQLEWRDTANRENISLFQYSGRRWQLGWRWDN